MRTVSNHVGTSLPVTAAAFVLAGVALASEGPSAAASVSRLKAGNARFVANPAEPLPIDAEQRTAAAKGQAPFAGILSCTDSRVPPEIVFHTGLGDLFVVRSAAQVTDKSVLASLEHAVDTLHVPVIVVMGHEACDLVRSAGASAEAHAADRGPKAAIHGDGHAAGHDSGHGAAASAVTTAGHAPDQGAGANMDYLAGQIRPAVNRTASMPADVRLRAAILENVEEQINQLLTGSVLLRRRAESGELAFVGAYYELTSGSVHFSELVKVAPVAVAAAQRH
jgi:carbonic anhydrase